ncbi:MAG: phosphoglucomutase/phosphomannomutase family protein [Lachnospiraceae bacterium]|nr:phosphoglucomutase/phosphomannomutase family protein [Lachnospiraceae bacterium]
MVKFGTGGWRAVIGDGFTKENIQLLAQGMVNKMRSEGVTERGIVMGYDRRFLSKEAMQWAAMVFAAAHIKVYLINKSSPTPLVMFYVMKHEFPYGMMITASHNPAIYNGIKVFTAGGRDADEIQTKDLENYIRDIGPGEVGEVEYDAGKKEGWIEEIYPLNEYLDNIIASVDMQAIREAGLKVALDPMYGVSETSLKMILMTARCEVATIHDRHDTLFGGKLPAPSAATLHSLQNYVVEKKFDIGIATDGDADRIGVIDDQGNFLHPNDILVLLYYYLVRFKGWSGPVVRNIATTHMLDKVAARFGENCYEVPVGFKHISAKMNETGAIIGGESSGGLTVHGHINGKDGIYAAALLVEMIAVTGKKLSGIMADIRQECGEIHMEERDYKFTKEKKAEMYKILIEDKLLPELSQEIDRISYLDGSKVYFKNGGWVIARFSGTEPLLRIFCEMPKSEEAAEICGIYEEFLGLTE